MSWLGGSLSSLTGQLSNLTKDILTEGTEEVSGMILSCFYKKKAKPDFIDSVSQHCNEKGKDLHLETVLLCEMGPQLKLPIHVTKRSIPLQCNTYFPKLLAM